MPLCIRAYLQLARKEGVVFNRFCVIAATVQVTRVLVPECLGMALDIIYGQFIRFASRLRSVNLLVYT